MYPPIKKFYDRTTAAMLARGAAAAYGGDMEIRGWAAALGGEGCEIIRDSGTETLVFAAAGDDFAVVCFRGTADLRNWMTDLDARRVQWRMDNGQWITGVRVHEGFLRALEAVWGELKDIVDSIMAGRKRVWFTGHSLGGALAMLAGARWSQCGAQGTERPTGWVYTFGQPRVGNGGWARWYDARLKDQTFRVIHADDVVARVPWLLQAYRHGGTEVFYPAGARDAAGRMGGMGRMGRMGDMGSYLMDAPWWRKAGSDLRGLCQEWRQGRMALLADHHVDTYVRLLDGPPGRARLRRAVTRTIISNS